MSAYREALRAFSDNRERYWWQSRSGLRDCPELVDLVALARQLRATQSIP